MSQSEPWNCAQRHSMSQSEPWNCAQRHNRSQSEPWNCAQRHSRSQTEPWNCAQRHSRSQTEPWNCAQRHSRSQSEPPSAAFPRLVYVTNAGLFWIRATWYKWHICEMLAACPHPTRVLRPLFDYWSSWGLWLDENVCQISQLWERGFTGVLSAVLHQQLQTAECETLRSCRRTIQQIPKYECRYVELCVCVCEQVQFSVQQAMCSGSSSTVSLTSAIGGGWWAPGPVCTGAENLVTIYCISKRVVLGCQFHE